MRERTKIKQRKPLAVAVVLSFVGALLIGTLTPVGAAAGDHFTLGQFNRSPDSTTVLKGRVTLKGRNTVGLTVKTWKWDGTALSLSVKPGNPPMTVDSDVKVENLNADQLDGHHASDFADAGTTVNGVNRAADADKLGGTAAADYATDAEVAALLGGGTGTLTDVAIDDTIAGDALPTSLTLLNSNGVVVTAKCWDQDSGNANQDRAEIEYTYTDGNFIDQTGTTRTVNTAVSHATIGAADTAFAWNWLGELNILGLTTLSTTGVLGGFHEAGFGFGVNVQGDDCLFAGRSFIEAGIG